MATQPIVQQNEASALFEQADQTASAIFDGAEQEKAVIPQTQTPNVKTAQLAAIATSDEGLVDPVGNPLGTAAYLEQQLMKATDRLANAEEIQLRSEVAAKRTIRQQLQSTTTLKNLYPSLPKGLGSEIYANTAAHFRENYQKNVRTALEREALERVQDLATSDPTQAKILLNRHTPGKMSANDVWQDYMVTNAALMQRYEKAQEAERNESWAAAIFTGILNLVQPSSFSYLGNVDEGVGGYNPSHLRFFLPQREIRAQQMAFWSLPADERLAYIDKMDANITNNATTWWVQDPDKRVELLGKMITPMAESEQTEGDVWNAVELGMNFAPYVGVVPYRALGRVASVPGLMLQAGARTQAAEGVAQAYDHLIKAGPDVAKAKTGIDGEEVVDFMSPSIVNPHGLGSMPDTHISMAGEINDNLEKARQTLAEFNQINTERMTTNEEITAAFEKAQETVAQRFGNATVLDVKPYTTSLADGTITRGVRVTLGKPGGGLHASEAEARGFASANGFQDVGIKTVAPETRVELPADHADYNVLGYHGTKGDFIEFDPSTKGKTTQAGSAKQAFFFSSPKGAYKGWTKLEWEQYADELEQEAGPFVDIQMRAENDGFATDYDFNSYKYTTVNLTEEDLNKIVNLWWEKIVPLDSFTNKTYKDLEQWLEVHSKEGSVSSLPDAEFSQMIGKIDEYYDREISAARNADPSNAATIAWSYARMGSKNLDFSKPSPMMGKIVRKTYDELSAAAPKDENGLDNIYDSSRWSNPAYAKILFTDGDIVDQLVTLNGAAIHRSTAELSVQMFFEDLTQPWALLNNEDPIHNLLLSKLKRNAVDLDYDLAAEGGVIYPVKIKGQNLKVVEGDRSVYDDVVYGDELALAKKEGYDGVVFKDARDPGNIDHRLPEPADQSYDVIAVFEPENVRMQLSPGKITQDSSGGFAVEVDYDIPDTAFLTNPLSPPPQGFLAKFWKNASQTSDKSVFAKAVMADSKFARMQQIIDKNLMKPFRALKTKERIWLNQVLAKGVAEERWFRDDEFKILVERAMGKPPSDRMIKAYQQYHLNNDIEYVMRNDGLWREKVIRKYESFKFNAMGDEFDKDGILLSGDKVPSGRVYNVSDNIHYVEDDALNAPTFKDLKERNYVFVRLEKPVKLRDGVEINHIAIKKSDLDIRPLRRDQLGYIPGGHTLYTDPIFVKQALKGTHPDTGQEFWKEPGTHATAANMKEARDYSKIMNAAVKAVVDGKDAAYLDEVVFAGRGGPVESNLPFPSGEDFIKMVEDGRVSKTEPFEAVYDRELPSAYRQHGVDISRFMDEEDLTGLAGYYKQTGRMYYSKKGERLRSVKGGLAPIVDPFEAQSRALTNVARLSGSFSDFKTNSIERWVKTYVNDLDTRMLSEESGASPYQIFLNANIKNGTPPALVQQITGQREAIKRILGFKSEFERGYDQWLRSMSEWVIGDSDSVLRRKVSEGFLWMEDHNPVGFLRGLAFDMKLGLFNWGQFFIQTSTMASALALNPKHGKFGLFSALPVWSYFLSKGNENVLETLVKRGVHKLAGFEDAATFKKYVREARQSGFFSLGDTHAQVNDFGYASTFGSLGESTHNIRELGRTFFYNAEVMNRLVAHRIAFGEAVEKYGIDAMDNFEFKEFMAARAENYSFNMSGVSKAWWQHGVLSVPTQFWAYNMRMIEAMTGSNFTAAQKLRLIGMQVAMAGSAGLPIAAGLVEYAKNKTGVEPDIDSMLGTLDRGLGDKLIYEMFGADVNISEKWGTGTWSSDLLKDLMGMSEYNQKSFAEITLGATGSILWTTLGPAIELVKNYMTHESGSEQVDLNSEQWIKLFSNISTVGNGLKAVMASQYGIYRSNKGFILADNIPSQDAVWIAMGLRPHELDESAVMQAYTKDRSEAVREAANQLTMWRQEAFANPDEFEEYTKRVNAFVSLLPADMRTDVLRQAHRNTEPSLYRSIEERYKKVIQKEELAREMNQ